MKVYVNICPDCLETSDEYIQNCPYCGAVKNENINASAHLNVKDDTTTKLYKLYLKVFFYGLYAILAVLFFISGSNGLPVGINLLSFVINLIFGGTSVIALFLVEVISKYPFVGIMMILCIIIIIRLVIWYITTKIKEMYFE